MVKWDGGSEHWALLQWVHGPITVVMSLDVPLPYPRAVASMGPRSDNRGYGYAVWPRGGARVKLQWVHGPITVVMSPAIPSSRRARSASMGPRSENRGYVDVRRGG